MALCCGLDRELNQMCEEMIEISDGKVSHYPGNYDQYLVQKKLKRNNFENMILMSKKRTSEYIN